MLNVCLVDLFDLRYNKERQFILIPSISLNWSGTGRATIFTIAIFWLNLELDFTFFNIDYYCDKLEELIEQMERASDIEDKEE